ncbi:MAG: polysaccharide deacetylase family protein [Chloroflexaceae bacterium]|nr:polysaccharide deacetylase family protein [Chloroflexaceae bacterium]
MLRKLHGAAHWLKRRSPQYVVLRLYNLIQRYGLTTAKARNRVIDCILLLRRYGCAPTFPTPGRVVERNPDFCHAIQQMGAELAIHGYDHIDFHSLSQAEARWQFDRAIATYQQAGVGASGFRCPYLSYSERLLEALPAGQLCYSSNTAVLWDEVNDQPQAKPGAIYTNLTEFYAGASSAHTLSVPHTLPNGMIEIPVSLPDDMQIYDGLHAGRKGLALAWLDILRHSYQRGEMFTLLFHPELYYLCALAFERLLIETRSVRPGIWVARLSDIAAWWHEKADFRVAMTHPAEQLELHFTCSERATILARHLPLAGPTQHWRDAYQQVLTHSVCVPAAPLPLLGVADDVPAATAALLAEQGYLIQRGAAARDCATYIDAALVQRMATPVALIAYIEHLTTPLIRYWRWPSGYASVLSFSGDLDALSLMDYAARIVGKAKA